jgi:RNA polymerase sigma factor (sigma-70 family)
MSAPCYPPDTAFDENAGPTMIGVMSDATSDTALGDLCRSGDARAWTELVKRFTRLVYSIPRRYRLSDSDCDDVHQASFAALVTALSKGERIDRLGAWLATVAHREAWRIGRNRGRTLNLADFESVAEPNPSLAQRSEEEQAVREGLETMGPPCRELLVALFAGGGEPHYPTISEQLGMPAGSIGPTRARCLSRLEKILRERGICTLSSGTTLR